MPGAPRVFISYSHDDDTHKARVLALADRLRHGCTVTIDQYVQFPPEGWPLWCEKQIEEADRVLLVCTETYYRRVRNEEPPGKGLGVLHEAHIIRQELYDSAGVSTKFVPVRFSDGSDDHIPRTIKRFSRYVVDTAEGFEQLYRLLTEQPATPAPSVVERIDLPPQDRPGLGDYFRLSLEIPAIPVEPISQAALLFIGRGAELERLLECLLAPAERRLPVVVYGMAGVGKTYLVDRVFDQNRAAFPGRYVRLSLDPENLPGAGELLAQIADRLKLTGADPGVVAARLQAPATLLHIENVDTKEAGRLAGNLAAALPGAPLVFTARLRGLGTASGWGQIPLDPFGDGDALAQLRAEVGNDAPHQDDWPELVAALGRLPLALHLAAGHLKHGGETPESFLKRLRAKGLALEPVDPADPAFRERSKALVSATFDLSLAALEREGGAAGEGWVQGLLALGWATPAGVGESLGAAISGLDAEAFGEMWRAAVHLSLLERPPRPDGPAFRLHPLLAELGRARSDGAAAVARMTRWFCKRLSKPVPGEPSRWNEVHAETPALLDWLPQVPAAERVRVVRAGTSMAGVTGPFHAWRPFCEAALGGAVDDAERSDVLWALGHVAWRGGDPDAGLNYARQQIDVNRRRGAEREAALAAALTADIRDARDELDEAYRIRRDELLPVFERLGDVRSRTAIMGEIARFLRIRGDLDEALRIHREEELPVYEGLGDLRARALTLRKIADILVQRGELEEAARIRSEEELPVYKSLGDARLVAVTMGKLADIFQMAGGLDAALHIRRTEELPVYDRIGDVGERALAMQKIAVIEVARGNLDEAMRIYREEVLPSWERIGDSYSRAVTMGCIADALRAGGRLNEAVRIRRDEVLPVYERQGKARDLVLGREKLALLLLARKADGDSTEANGLLCVALADARRMRLPAAERIEAILAEHGLRCD